MLEPKDIVTLVVAGAVALVWAVLEIKRWRANRRAKQMEEDAGLPSNPTRCADHETRLRGVEKVCNEVGPKIDGLEKDISEIKGDVKHLINLHLKG